MNTIEIPEINLRRKIPSKWDEMSPKNVRYAMQMLWNLEHGEISPLEFHIRILYKLLEIHRNWRSVRWDRLHPDQAEIKNDNINRMCAELLSWMFSDTEEGLLPTFDAICNPLPQVRIGFRHLIGPDDGLKDLTLEEFRNALIARDEFLKTQQTEALDRMISFLYRKRSNKVNRGGRSVTPIRHETICGDIRRASRIAPWQKQTILLWFSACVKSIQTGQITVAGEDIDMKSLFSGDGSDNSGLAYTWTDVIYELAKEQAIGTMDDIDAEGLYNIFLILHHNVKQAKRNERDAPH